METKPSNAECNISFSISPELAVYNRLESWCIVDCVLKYIQSTGTSYFTGPSETTLEGSLNELLAIVAGANRICIEQGALEVISNLKIYYSPQEQHSFAERLQRTEIHRTQ